MKFLDFLNGWVRLTNVLNELSRSMGQPDYYPFVLPRAAVGKLQFVHQVIAQEREHHAAPPARDPAPPASEPAPEQVEAQQQEQAQACSPMRQQYQEQRFMPARRRQLSGHGLVFQRDVHRQAVEVRRIVLALDERRQVAAATCP